jgi:enoyl-CoA hydratase/carnithine racemase
LRTATARRLACQDEPSELDSDGAREVPGIEERSIMSEQAPFRHVRYERSGRIANLILNRPRYRNAQSRVLLEEMDAAFRSAEADDEVRVIVLAGEGDHFSSGHDLGTPDEVEDARRRPYGKGVRAMYQRSWDLFIDKTLRWRDLTKPTIAAVQGFCIFGGWMIASAMDIIIAADDARFLPALLQYFSIPWDLGPRKAKEILFQSRFVEAEEACRLGFVNMVVPRAKLMEEAMAMAARIAETDRFTLRMTKLAVNQAQDAMGFSAGIKNAHAQHMLLALGGYLREEREGEKPPLRLKGVDQALKKIAKE